MLRSNAIVGLSGSLVDKLRDAADLECTMSKHAFGDTQAYVKQIVGIMMDETASGRDSLIQIIREFNKKLPFIVLNDFRIAQATNSLKRVEIMRDLLFSKLL